MSEANRRNTITTGRRSIAAGGFAMLVLAAAAAGTAKAEELDGELLALCNTACDIHAGSIRIEDEYEAKGLDIPYAAIIRTRTRLWHELCDQIAATPARVLADVIALEQPLVASLCADLLGRASA
jgi:hypothetical protein